MADKKNIDPRIKLTLLPIVGFTSFFISDTILLFVLIVFAFFLYLYSGMWKRALRFILFFVLLYCIELGLGKFCQASIVFAIYMFIYFASRMTLIAMFGGYITKTTSVSEMLEALNRMKVPRSIGIPFSVLLRFLPTIKIELKALKENMKYFNASINRAAGFCSAVLGNDEAYRVIGGLGKRLSAMPNASEIAHGIFPCNIFISDA